MSERARKYAIALISNDKKLAMKMSKFISKEKLQCISPSDYVNWKSICDFMEYPYINAFTSGYMSSHFRRVLNEIKILSIFGKHTFHHFNNLSKLERIF